MAPKPAITKLYTTKDVCEIFQVHPKTIATWYRDGLFSRVRVGKKNYYRPDEIQRLIDRSTTRI